MNTCEEVFCDCNCLSPKIKTEVILYPAPPSNKLKSQKGLKLRNNLSSTQAKIISHSKMESSGISNSFVGRISDNTDIQSI